MKESDILHERGRYWVCRAVKKGFEVYRVGITHSTRCAIIGYDGPRGLAMAKAECDRRAELDEPA